MQIYCVAHAGLFNTPVGHKRFSIGPKGGRTQNTYRRFHNAIKELSKQYPDDIITFQYTLKNREDDPGETHIIEYKNGMAVVTNIETNE